MTRDTPPHAPDRVIRGRSPYTRRRRPGFVARLVLTLVVTTTVIGLAQYLLAARALTGRVVEQATAGHASDARVLEGLHADATGDGADPVRELLSHIASRPGIEQVAVVGPDARVIAVGARHAPRRPAPAEGHAAPAEGHAEPAGGHPAPARATGGHAAGGLRPIGERAPLPYGPRALVDEVLALGTTYGGAYPGSGEDHGLYAVPLSLGGRRHALVVVKASGALSKQLADMRWILFATLGLGLLTALPLFFLLGGRSLTARHRKAISQSSLDALTGLGNHRSFHEEMRRMVEIAQRRERRLTLVLVDLDRFKHVNDTSGHHGGDALLAQLGRILLSGRAGDVAFRIGGDEFAVLLPDTDAEEAAVVAERIRARVETEMADVTASVGVAQLGVPAPDADTLLASADVALYDAKGAGRNRVATFMPAGRTAVAG